MVYAKVAAMLGALHSRYLNLFIADDQAAGRVLVLQGLLAFNIVVEYLLTSADGNS